MRGFVVLGFVLFPYQANRLAWENVCDFCFAIRERPELAIVLRRRNSWRLNRRNSQSSARRMRKGWDYSWIQRRERYCSIMNNTWSLSLDDYSLRMRGNRPRPLQRGSILPSAKYKCVTNQPIRSFNFSWTECNWVLGTECNKKNKQTVVNG